MQMSDRRRETEAESRARLRAALLQPHEALHHTFAIARGNARTMVGYAETDAIPLPACRDHDVGRHAIHFRRMGTRVFDGVVDEIGERLGHQLAVAAHRQGCAGLDLERHALFVGERIVKLTDPADDVGGVGELTIRSPTKRA